MCQLVCQMFQGPPLSPSSECDVIMDTDYLLFGLTFSPDWCISVLLDHTSRRVPGSRTLQPLSMLKFLGWSLISTTSFIKLSMYPVALPSMEVLLKLISCPVSSLCSATTDFSWWPRCVCLMWSLHLVSMVLPICPTYVLKNLRGMQYIPVTFNSVCLLWA